MALRILLSLAIAALVSGSWGLFALGKLSLTLAIAGTVLALVLLVVAIVIAALRARAVAAGAAAALAHQPPRRGDDLPAIELALLRGAIERSRAAGRRLPRELPLHLVVGLADAGKTALLDHCGLQWWFQSPRKGLRVSTRVSDEAAFVEFTAAPDARSDAGETARLARALGQATRTRPLAGVLVCVAVDGLRDDAAFAAARTVLELVVQHCGVQVPVHVVITKLDRMPGHAELAHAIAGSNSALGVQLPLPGDARRSEAAVQGFVQRVHEVAVGLLHGAAQGTVLRFAMALEALAPALVAWTGRLHAPTRGGEALALRSVYFTSTRDRGPVSASLLPPAVVALGLVPPLDDRGRDGPTPLGQHALASIVADAELARPSRRGRTAAVLRWSAPLGLGLAVAGGTAAAVIAALPDQAPPPPPVVVAVPAPEPEAPAKPKVADPEVDPCAELRPFEGSWAFRTHVDGSTGGGGIDVVGHYTMNLVVQAATCTLAAEMVKQGWTEADGSFVAHDPVQRSSDILHRMGDHHAGHVPEWVTVGHAVFARDSDDKRFDLFLAFGVRDDGNLVGAFEYLADHSTASRLVWGRITGRRGSEASWDPSLDDCATRRFVTRSTTSSDANRAFRDAANACDLEAR
ncbi:MAG: hypothetical protein IPH07_02720 [Deltaproteobacteria bacterium]|nr:hypothetical protein [Deltaproteobacteria bacterium]MBK8238076.1 hypothetical protein [Deltaproteobacteria bacterium]MBK8718581.1 hypothetical protein [Deltaproteobacteria bacterium]MBP7290840.1 hypothetical protein [Nannocystaceae bacterium]